MNSASLKARLVDKVQALDASAGRTEHMQNTAITTYNSSYIALTNNALNVISENLKSQPLSISMFDVIKSPAGGTTAFTVPGLSGDEIVKELIGIILDYTMPRAYWDTPDPKEGTPPICYSLDSIISHDGKPCFRCPFNDFGSKDGESNAKACKESVMLYMLRPDNILPAIVRVPVSSKLIFQRYLTRLISRMIPLSSVVTKITLEKATNKTGQPYALYNFEAILTLSPEEAEKAKAFGQKFMEIMNAANLYAGAEEGA
jgi:hypothetical protein